MTTVMLEMTGTMILAWGLITLMWVFYSKGPLSHASVGTKRAVVGIVFGLAGIASTHFGIAIDGAVLNVRDSFALAAAFFFDPWAGVIAGLIAGIERLIVGTWFGVGTYTTVACFSATSIAGIIGALMSVLLFDRRKPSVFYAVVIAMMVEVFHMLMVMLTHMDDLVTAMKLVQLVSMPMIVANAAAFGISAFFIGLISGKYKQGIRKQDPSERPITRTFQIWLLLFVTVLFLITFAFTYFAQTKVTESTTESTMALNADDIVSSMDDSAEQLMQVKTLLSQQARSSSRSVASDVTSAQSRGTLTNAYLSSLASLYDIYEINVVDSTGRIAYSTNESYVGFDMNSGEQSRAFLVLLDGTTTDYLQDFQPIAYDSSISIMYSGTSIPGGFVQVGYDSSRITEYDSLADMTSAVVNRRIGQTGYAVMADADGKVVSGNYELVGKSLSDIGATKLPTGSEDIFYQADVNGTRSFVLIRKAYSYYLTLVLPSSEAYSDRNVFAYETAFMYLLLFAAVFNVIYGLVKGVIVKNLDKVNNSLARITQGGLDEVVDVRSSAEFTSLSNDINTTVQTLKHYISEAEARIDAELEFARSIQLSALPHDKKPFADRPEFDLSASMHTAREVGGDFYDYFLIDDDHLALVMADVSGKGIPAALFMMKSKTLIKSLASAGSLSPSEVLAMANNELCEGNDAEMFVTVWMGILEISTGKMICANAGHEFPAIRRLGGSYELFHDKHGFVLGGMEGMSYVGYELELHPGDDIFLYTDGVTEATNTENELFGEERLIKGLNDTGDSSSADILEDIKSDIDSFVGEASQFDDITMMSLRLAPPADDSVDSITVDADVSELERVQAFADEAAEKGGADAKTRNQIALVVEEVFVNVAHYAYGGELGPCTVERSLANGTLVLRFRDRGVAYDPLTKDDPDITLSADDREIGGLGIFLTKTLMDSCSYERVGDENVLALEKELG